jgi:predicted DNA-binding transcriptional regulator AlpA
MLERLRVFQGRDAGPRQGGQPLPTTPTRPNRVPIDEKALLSRAAAARWLGVTVDTLRGWMRNDPTFPRPKKIGRRGYYVRRQIELWLEMSPAHGEASDE